MALYKNPDPFKIAGDKTVKVTVVMEFKVGEDCGDFVVMRNAKQYLSQFLDSPENAHSAWGRSIEVKHG